VLTTYTFPSFPSKRKLGRALSGWGPKAGPPDLVVLPRSLVFNWRSEAERFTPELRVLDHAGLGRRREKEHLEQFDLVITT
jgi:SNF2 family DNA or RNA helicase